ncbi:hypothetical protein CHLNCDRAFT_35348 [Chlorella variabilis]|uniref:Mitochondrial substrate carrier family B n=1 Tax=Chlorella variabilis TaxID=554065 RepID=E1ZDN5_CHLVA|nr:hypothetical protein CHLNCDRAFT_35348 [Chlorella variabilis]EFN56052.1 hypothetical protein CHLNCDRAFT_35348 [Chlorella variabilis]|eukprot:XP_005848154.1 hypothetical protein CHLNCDRAFT_35348 [Chlorella variabilis]
MCNAEGEGCEADVTRAVVVDEERHQLRARPAAAAAAAAAGDEGGPTAAAVVADLDEDLLQEEATSSGSLLSVDTLEQAKLLLSGGVAGAFSKSCTAPLARLTILYQVNGMQTAAAGSGGSLLMRLGVGAALRHVARTEGLAALWKGNGVTIIHRLPYSATNFWVYEHVNELWKRHIPSQGAWAAGDVARRLVAGGVAGMSACALAYPLDLVRTRLAAQTTRSYYTGIGHALRTIVADEGARGLYRGLGPTLLQVAPSLAINYAAYETMRSAWLAQTDLPTPTVPMSLACGSAAGLVSSTATFPLDLVRRRLQLRGQGGAGGGGPQQPATFRGTFSAVLQREGVRGLYSGILPEYYKVVPGVAIAFCTYELMKKMLGVQTNATQR